VDAFYLAGISLSELGPLRRLLGALEDADRGIHDPIATPSSPSSRAPDFSRKWEARAIAVIAYEILMEFGLPASKAAQQVTRELRLSGFEARFIRVWRDRFRRKGEGEAPRDGQHWEALKEGRAEIERCRSLGSVERRDGLKRLYEGCIRHAQRLLPDQPKRKNPQA
jgi:hypothetical protein